MRRTELIVTNAIRTTHSSFQEESPVERGPYLGFGNPLEFNFGLFSSLTGESNLTLASLTGIKSAVHQSFPSRHP